MAKSSDYVKHIESFVVSSTSLTQQVESINAIASLLKEDMLTLEALVREMEMYLTTTDSTIRGRGILLLGELMTCLVSKPMENSTIHSLLGFFTERLADWRVLHGALVGCLALLKRKGNVGMVGGTEALAAAQSYFQNVQVQSLGHRDRKVCFELLKCLLDRYPDDILPLGDVLIFGICESIDGEKDPQCLMLAFHVVAALVQLFPDPSGPLESYAMDLFENLSCYFPVHFTHPNGEDADVKKDDLSKALMMVFGSTPLFEPFAVPLLLEKLSSSLPSAKVESLKYLSHCTEKYGVDRMTKHVEALWSALKDALYTAVHADLPLESELLDGTSFQDNEIVTEALVLLHRVILQSNSVLLDLIISDKDVNTTMDTIHSCKDYNNIPMQIKQRLHVVGRVLSVSARASMYSCNKVFGSFFPRIMDALATSDQTADKDSVISAGCNFAAIYLCTELLAASRALVVGSNEFITPNFTDHEMWCDMLYNFSSSLTKAFICTLATEIDLRNSDAYFHYGVRGLQLLATYPGKISAVSKSIYESILVQLMEIITLKFNKTSLWKLSLKALVEVGSFVHESQDSEKAQSFGAIVVEKIASLMVCDEINMPPSLKVEVISSIGMTDLNYMLRILEGLDKTLSSCLSEVYVHGDVKLTDTTISLLECYSNKVLPWFESVGGFEEVPLRLAVNIWDQIEASTFFSIDIQKEKLLPVAMMAMKHAVSICSEEGQRIIIHKAFSILSSSTSFLAGESRSETIVVTVESSHCGGFSCRDDWIISLYASVIIALRPKTRITNLKVVMRLFLTTHLNGHVPSAQALGSLINKIPVKVDDVDASEGCCLEEALDMIFSSWGWSLCNIDPIPKCSPAGYDSKMAPEMLNSGKISPLLQRHAITGLAWIGKGLLMRGHEKVKDIILTFLNCLLLWKQKDSADQELLNLTRSAADAFNTLISDSETCLSRRFHATIRPLYKQRLFSMVSPILLSSLVKADSTFSREMLYRAFANIVSNTPLSAMLSEAKKLIPVLLDGLFKLSEDKQNKNILYNVLLVLSGIITDKTGQEAVIENINVAIGCLIELISYPHMMLIRETAIECLVATSELPYARIYPMRIQVLASLSKALDDPKRAVRQEAVRCIQAWASIAPRSPHF